MKNRKYNSIALLLIAMLFISMSGCVSVELDDRQGYNSQDVSLVLTTQSGASSTRSDVKSDKYVGSLRVIVFEVTNTGGSLTYVRQIQNEFHSEATNQIKVEFKKCDLVRVFLIANENPDWKLGDSSKSAQELKDFTVSYATLDNLNVDIATPLSMFGESHTLSGQSNGSATIELERNVARVDLTLACKASDLANTIGFKPGGELKINSVRIAGMAPNTGLANAKKNPGFASDSYLTSVKQDVSGYKVINDPNGNFSEFTITGISFYVPEHYVTNTKYHTYITILGEYIPSKGAKGIPVEYTLPVGYVITQEKVDANSFVPSDLKLERNHVYEMSASFKSLQQISEMCVAVKEWEEKEVDGSISKDEIYKLNISDLKPTLGTEDTKSVAVQFWSNVAPDQIKVDAKGYIKDSEETFTVNDIFVSLAGEGAANLTIIGDAKKGEQWGHLQLMFQSDKAEIGKTYVITLTAGVLKRTIEVTAIQSKL